MVAILALLGCSNGWVALDADGDGWTVAGGDCWDDPGANRGVMGADIHPEAPDVPYDGIDADCRGDDDFDYDGDGFVLDGWSAAETEGIRSTLPRGDCWDDRDAIALGFTVIEGFRQMAAGDVHPGATELYYDGVDANCDGDDDMDEDGDGHASSRHGDAQGESGDDCFDADDDLFENPAGLSPAAVHPGAAESCYDGTDANCDGWSDWDCDEDGYLVDADCDDTEPTAMPSSDSKEIWYNGIDENCDGNDADQDGDGYAVLEYSGQVPLHMETGDCWDDPTLVPPEMVALHELPQLDARAVHPAAVETAYDGIDANCDGLTDFDQDADGFATADLAARDGSLGTDCDDSDALVSPDGIETCLTAYDDDCDSDANEVDAPACTQWFADGDGDGYGVAGASACFCTASDPWTANNSSDCDDTAVALNPGVNESCTTTYDDDCDVDTNDPGADGCTFYYDDADGDGYSGGPGECLCAIAAPFDDSSATDCNDDDPDVNPAAPDELCDNAEDDNCDGTYDTCANTGEQDVDVLACASLVGTTTDPGLGTNLAAGDADGDGTRDVFVSAKANASAYLFYGAIDVPEISASTDAELTITGPLGSELGSSLLVGPDLDGDGSADLAVGSRLAEGGGLHAGDARIFFGIVTGDLDHADADIVLPGTSDGQTVGSALAADDWTGDGQADLAVGASADDTVVLDAGAVFLLAGPLSGSASLSSAVRYDGPAAQDNAGASLASGDIDGDGIADVLVGAPGSDDGASGAGAAFVVLGPATAGGDLSSSGYALYGPVSGAQAGVAVAIPGDLDGDGLLDLVIGAPYSSTGGGDAGTVYVVSGALVGDPDLSNADSIDGDADDLAGWALGGIDLDSDGRTDLVVGAPGADLAAVFYGPPGGSLDLSAGLLLTGDTGSNFGFSVANLGQQNLDALDDLLVGAPTDSTFASNGGVAWLIPGAGY